MAEMFVWFLPRNHANIHAISPPSLRASVVRSPLLYGTLVFHVEYSIVNQINHLSGAICKPAGRFHAPLMRFNFQYGTGGFTVQAGGKTVYQGGALRGAMQHEADLPGFVRFQMLQELC